VFTEELLHENYSKFWAQKIGSWDVLEAQGVLLLEGQKRILPSSYLFSNSFDLDVRYHRQNSKLGGGQLFWWQILLSFV
jgi:hypothetical protein